MMFRKARIGFGLLCWSLMIGAAGYLLWAAPAGSNRRFAGQQHEYWLGERRALELNFAAPGPIAVGDPIFHQDATGQWQQVGEIRRISAGGTPLPTRAGEADSASAVLFPNAPLLSPAAAMRMHETPRSFGWVVQTLLPADKRAAVEVEIRQALADHQSEIAAALMPILEQSVRDALAVVEVELPQSINRHRAELESLGAKYQDRVIRKELVPLVRQEIWPIAREEADPLIEEVGRELWDELSLWRFGWRFLYDASPLPEQQLTEQEWHRFVEENALPALERHSDDFIALIQTVVQRAAANPRVRKELRQYLKQMMADPELRTVLGKIAREVFIDNPRLHAVLKERWTGPEAQQAFKLAGERLEPSIRRIGDQLFGTREAGITPEFAAILRSQVLVKDRRWLVLVDTAPELANPATAPTTLRVEWHDSPVVSPLLGRTFRQ